MASRRFGFCSPPSSSRYDSPPSLPPPAEGLAGRSHMLSGSTVAARPIHVCPATMAREQKREEDN